MMGAAVDTLNANQREAVLWDGGPLLVLAGRGSGKTHVLTTRVVRLLEADEASSVLALTSRPRAASEMRTRLERQFGGRAERARLCTFHSFASDLLRQHGSHLGLKPDFRLLTQEEDRLHLVEETASSLRDIGEDVAGDPYNLLRLVDRLFAESYDGKGDSTSLVQTPGWIPSLFDRYCASLLAANRLDYGSLLYFARRLLQERSGVARVVRLAWSHICVDEFQDTNRAQYDLLRLLARERDARLFVVGDEDQITLQWSGASPERLNQLQADYEPRVVQLPQSYRCPAPVLSLANRLIRYNAHRFEGKACLRAADGVPRRNAFDFRYETLPSPGEEAKFVARDIRHRRLSGSEVVVLGRTNKLVGQVATVLEQSGIDAFKAQRKTDFEAPAIRVVIEALRLANARHDREILRRLCVAWQRMSDDTLEVGAIAAAAALVGGDYLRAWADAASGRSGQRDRTIVDQVRACLLDSMEFRALLGWFLQPGGPCEPDDGNVLLEEEKETWRALDDDLVREHGGGSIPLNRYLQQLDLASKVSRPRPGAVRCMTVHGSKGLGFPHVYLIGMAQEVFPSFQALRKGSQSKELEEERRNCFVAVTRVERTLTLTRSEEYYDYPKPPSQFLQEMGIS